ncbi:MAG: bifunctional folylpolyglutamate synthase/dihydrofolate synthase, partial [Synergistaceae bacterium]|nr:bifunctional folylpolyglutamate synthase/dihydrofolate synthase [Synergistaceae bacterium]
DKDVPGILETLKTLECPVFCTELPMERSASALSLSGIASEIGMKVGGCFQNPSEALEAASGAAVPPELVLCCGSLFLVGNLRRELVYRGIL